MNAMPMPDTKSALSNDDRRLHAEGGEAHRRLNDSLVNRLSRLIPGVVLLLAVTVVMAYLIRAMSG